MPSCAVTEKETIIKRKVTIDFIADNLGREYTEMYKYGNTVYKVRGYFIKPTQPLPWKFICK